MSEKGMEDHAVSSSTEIKVWKRKLLCAAGGLLLDHMLGEPPFTPHPVACYGRLTRALEGLWWSDNRFMGALHAACGVFVAALAAKAVGSATLGTYLACAGKALRQEALEVAALLERGDLQGARARLPALVGRDVQDLDESQCIRAVIESLAENTVDALVAPCLWAAAGGATGALAYRGINTLDAQVGYKDERYRSFGWASARLDDVANIVPARLTMILVMAARPLRALAVLRSVRLHWRNHPSPNAGVAEAAFAGALEVRLGGPSTYRLKVEERPFIGLGRQPELCDIYAGVRLCSDVQVVLGAILTLAGLPYSKENRLSGSIGRAGMIWSAS